MCLSVNTTKNVNEIKLFFWCNPNIIAVVLCSSSWGFKKTKMNHSQETLPENSSLKIEGVFENQYDITKLNTAISVCINVFLPP